MIHRLLQTHLEPVERDRRHSQLWRGLAFCWAGAALAGGLLLVVRRFTGSSPVWSFALLLLAALVGAIMVLRGFVRTSPDYQALARRIEAENPQLHALLLTAVEQQPSAPGGELNYLQQRVVSEALAQYLRSDWAARNARRLRVACWSQWAALALFVLTLIGLRPDFSRARTLWTGAERSNGVAVTPGDTMLERGSGLVVLARFEGKLPPDATLVVQPVNQPAFRVPLTKNLDDPVFGGGVPEVKGDLQYRVEFPSGQTRDFKVSVFDYPRLERADARVVYPAYTALPEKTIPDTRRVSAVEGSSLDYSFFLNKPVTSARLVAKDKSAVTLARDTNNASIYHAHFRLGQSHRYELLLVDDAGRTNRLPPEFVIESLSNRVPELKLAFPRGDQRVSALEEIAFQGEASDDFGLRAYGIAYSLAGGETRTIQLGTNSAPHEKRPLNHLLPLETLNAQPDQLLSYYLWAEDIGPDGNVRRTAGDMYFAEIRPFDEIFREGQSADSEQNQNSNNGQQGNQTEKLAELQKQIISATWNLQRRETARQPSARYKDDVGIIHDSQEQALEQARALKERVDDPRLQSFVDVAQKEMEKAARHLDEAAGKNALAPLSPALAEEQSAYQALIRLQSREYQVARNQRNQRNGSQNGQRAQQQIEQLDLKQTENRYETQRQASPTQNPEQREQMQVANRLKELAQRQQDLNQRLKELQTALQEAKSEQEREEIRQRLKRLREEQQELLADTDELRQRMDRPENQSRMADARQQLDQTRSELQQASEALDKDQVPRALASGTRAQRELQQLQDDFRKKNSSHFAEDMRQMRENARQLAQKQDEIAKKLEASNDSKHKTLNDSDERRELASQLQQQKTGLTNLFQQMRNVSEQSESSQPLLSRQLYDTLRQSNPEELNKSLDLSSELVERGFAPQASQFEQRARENINTLKRDVERAAENVVGDDTEALRRARRELDDLGQQLDRELASSATGGQTNATNAARQSRGNQHAQNRQQQQQQQGQRASNGRDGRAQPQSQPGQQRAQEQQQASAGGSQPGENNGENSNNDNNPANADGARGGNQRQQRDRELARNGSRRGFFDDRENNDGGGGGGEGRTGPITGEDFVEWSDRLRDVEEMVDNPDLRTEIARIRDRARATRLDFKRLGKKPDWAVVKTQIVEPLAEVRSRVGEELARRESKDALVPLDRDPVPAKFSELVRRYYEELGKSE